VAWLRRVRLRNFRSIAECDVRLGPLTVLVGANGSGKSSFLDALRFVRDALESSPYQAAESRGGLGEILCRVPSPSRTLRIDLDLFLPYGPSPDHRIKAYYGFELERGTRPSRRPIEVVWEECRIEFDDSVRGFRVEHGEINDSEAPGSALRQISPDRLYLPFASAQPNLAPVFVQLSHQYFYALRLEELRKLRQQREGPILGEAGEYLGDVLGELSEHFPEMKEHIDGYLSSIAPQLLSVDRRVAGDYVTVEARHSTGQGGVPVVFGAEAMSDGPIRAAGVLGALFQMAIKRQQVSLVAIEEPETALHPAAAGVLFDALVEAGQNCQVIATTQSDALFDRDDVDPRAVLAVQSVAGHSRIGPLGPMAAEAMRNHGFTVGELMRAGQLRPDPELFSNRDSGE
jgi:predicted ATPase